MAKALKDAAGVEGISKEVKAAYKGVSTTIKVGHSPS